MKPETVSRDKMKEDMKVKEIKDEKKAEIQRS